jgi:hypothetical protein
LNQVRNRVLNSSRIWSPTQLNKPPIPPQPHPLTATHCLYILYCTVGYVDFGKGGGVGKVIEKVEGQ